MLNAIKSLLQGLGFEFGLTSCCNSFSLTLFLLSCLLFALICQEKSKYAQKWKQLNVIKLLHDKVVNMQSFLSLMGPTLHVKLKPFSHVQLSRCYPTQMDVRFQMWQLKRSIICQLFITTFGIVSSFFFVCFFVNRAGSNLANSQLVSSFPAFCMLHWGCTLTSGDHIYNSLTYCGLNVRKYYSDQCLNLMHPTVVQNLCENT